MGYTTQFEGKLRFAVPPSVEQLAALNALLGEDAREHPEWEADRLSYIDLDLTNDFSGLKWSGAEKSCDMDKQVNVVITQMRKRWPEFGLTGALAAQGEDVTDRWALEIGADGLACKRKIAMTGDVVECPHCERKFVLAGKDRAGDPAER